MFYFDHTLIEAMARERLSRRGQLINLDMNNYSALGRTMQELFGDEIRIKIGFASDDSLPNNHKDIMVFIAVNQP